MNTPLKRVHKDSKLFDLFDQMDEMRTEDLEAFSFDLFSANDADLQRYEFSVKAHLNVLLKQRKSCLMENNYE